FDGCECRVYRCPGFPPGFCLQPLPPEFLWVPEVLKAFLACFDRFAGTYLKGVSWESPASIEARVAHLLPALFLARIDGKSTIEYVTTERAKNRVRGIARPLILRPPDDLGDMRRASAREVIAK